MVESPIHERILELRQVPVLRALAPPALAALAEAIEVEACAPGTVLMAEGRSVGAVSWLLEGRLRWTRADWSLGEGGPGTSSGVLELTAGASGSAQATVQSPALVARVAAERWFELLDDSFDLLHAVLSTTARELGAAGRRVLERAPALRGPALRGPALRGPALRGAAVGADIDFVERVVRLRSSRPFTRAPIRALAVLARRCELRRFARGTSVWDAGCEAREVVVVLGGEVADGPLPIGPSSSAGLVEALAGMRHQAPARARAPTVGLVFDVDVLLDVLEDDDELPLGLARILADELLALRLERGLPPDFFHGAPDRTLPRVW
jgi:CRP-like cAMP-binding protein